MPLNGFGSYVPTLDEFIAHWTDVNAARAALSLPPLTLKGGYTLEDLIADRNALQAAIIATESLDNARELAIDRRDSQKELLRDRLSQFRSALELHLKQTEFLAAAPTIPQQTLSESKFLRPFDDMADLWARINDDNTIPDFTPPLLLRAGLAITAFTAELAEMRARFVALTVAENDQRIGRRGRDALLPPVRERLNQYRSAIALEYPAGHPLSESQPDLSPAPGSTPDPVVLSGYWDEEMSQAVLSWTASTNPNLQVYELRGCIGATYNEAASEFLANYQPGILGTPTLFGLVNSGDTVTFKVFVKLTTGNQAGSNPVTITRT